MNLVSYRPPGPTAEQFHLHKGFVRGLMGPVGSGKSSTSIWEIVIKSLQQAPYNGVRESRWAVVRNTYPELKTTTIKTWQDWFPHTIAPMKWDTPITSRINQAVGDGTMLDLEVIFLALDRPEDIGKLKSLELTGGFINEAVQVPLEVFDMLTQRVGRFPAKRRGGPTWSGVILDTNPCDDDHWYYKFAEEDTPEGWAFFKQPGALMPVEDPKTKQIAYIPNPDAENILNIPNGYDYYRNMIGGKDADWIRVFVEGMYGTTRDGKPVYPEYRDTVHVAKEEIAPMAGLPIYLGWDYGLTPSCIVAQMSPKGQLIILEEFVAEDMGIRTFAREVVKPVMLNKYAKNRIESVGDPAGTQRAQTDEKTCQEELLECGIPTASASTNSFIARREAVAYFLKSMAGDQPGIILNPSCKMLRKGFIGGYRYGRLQVGGANAMFKDRPVKDKFSHPHDALQYLAMHVRDALNPVRARVVTHESASGWT